MRASIVVLTALSLTACGDAEPTDAVVPDLGTGKSDAIDHVVDRGPIALGQPRSGSFTEDLQFDGHRLEVRQGAEVRLEITRKGTAKKLDTTLFVYGPRTDAGFGTEAIAFDDDSGWGRQSRLDSLVLAGGEYLVVVGTHDARGRGAYNLLATCLDDACEPLRPVAAGCDEIVANNVLACVANQVADSATDPEITPLTRAEALEICTDGEALGPVFDNLCSSPQPASFCAAGFDAFAQEMGPACRDELAPFAVECVFGHEYRDLRVSQDIVRGRQRVLTSPVGLSELERAQVIAAVQSSAHTDVTTIDEAFERPDGGEINATELWDRTSARAYVVYEFGAGDTSVGAYFVHDTTERVAVISDGFLERCSAGIGPQGGDCSADADCSVGTCVGAPEASGVGRCTVLSGFGDQTACNDAADCDIDQGLVCAGLSRGDEGQCFPAWMRSNFAEAELGLEVPDGDAQGLSRTLTAYGLATVDMDVELDLFVEHPNAGQLRVTLTNPAGTEVVVFDGEGAPASSLRFDGPVLGFSGDEGVNGPWTLRVVDDTAGGAGLLDRWTLRLGSRFD